MEARDRPIKDWFTKVRTRQTVLPRFQRHEAWGPREISDLLGSVLRDLPIGSALVLAVGSEVPFKFRQIVGAPEEGERINELLLDGQQRVTALWRALKDNYEQRTYLVDLQPENGDNGDGAVRVIPQGRWTRNARRYPLWVDKPKHCWERKLIPTRVLDPDNETEYQDWADEASQGDDAAARRIERTISGLREKVANFNFPFLYLPVATPSHVAIEVFIKLNTNVVPLGPFDIVVAQLEEATGESLHELLSSLTRATPAIARYADPSTLVLSVSALLQGRLPNQRGFFGLAFERVLEDWPKIERGVAELIRFLEEEHVFDRDRLPTETVLAPLIALWAEAPEQPDERGNARIIFRKYLWRIFFTERYDRAVSTAVLQDYRAIREGRADEALCFDEDEYPLPDEDLLIQARWPRYRDRLARAILLLSLKGGAEDIADGAAIRRASIGDREYHHLYPVDWFRRSGHEESQTHRALNCALITWRTNRAIGARAPLQYLVERCEANALGEGEIRRRLQTHCIDYDSLASGDYDAFLRDRAGVYMDAIRTLCGGAAWPR